MGVLETPLKVQSESDAKSQAITSYALTLHANAVGKAMDMFDFEG